MTNLETLRRDVDALTVRISADLHAIRSELAHTRRLLTRIVESENDD